MKKVHILLLIFFLFGSATLFASPSFKKVCRDLVASNDGAGVVKGIDGWLFLKDELVHLGAGKFWGEEAATASRTKNKKNADPLPTIIEYNKMLAEKGISLYLMPVPPKGLVYPEKIKPGLDESLAAEDRALYNEFFTILEQSGVKSINLLPAMLEKKKEADLYCKTDTHYSGVGLALFAEMAAEAIKKESWYAGVDKKEYLFKTQKVAIKGDLTQMAGAGGVDEEIELSVVTEKGSGKLIETDMKSQVVLLGDSHTLVFSAGGDLHARGAGLFDHISADLGFPVDLLGVRGSGVTPARIKFYQRSKKDPVYLEGKKVLIWCFTAREFTGTGGWKKIPVAP